MLPRSLKNFQLFVDGVGYAGLCTQIDPPPLKVKAADYRGGGMDAVVKIDLGLEVLQAKFTMSELNEAVLGQVALTAGRGLRVVARGAMQRDGEDAVPVAITLEGAIAETTPGAWKLGEAPTIVFSMNCRYYKLEIGGAVIHEIDVDGMTRVINGVDQMETMRKAIGL